MARIHQAKELWTRTKGRHQFLLILLPRSPRCSTIEEHLRWCLLDLLLLLLLSQVVLGGLKSLQRAPYASLLERPRGIPFANVQVGIVGEDPLLFYHIHHVPSSIHLVIYPFIHLFFMVLYYVATIHHGVSTTVHHLSHIYPSWCSIMFHPLILVFHHVPSD